MKNLFRRAGIKRSGSLPESAWSLTLLVLLVSFTTSAYADGEYALVGSNGKLPSAFKHSVHVTDNNLECTYCHVGADKSTKGLDNLMPQLAVCADCHGTEDIANKGVHLASKVDGFLSIENDYRPSFNHQRHLEKAKLECTTCHANLDEPLTDGREMHAPLMSECMDCHAKRSVAMECNTCHLPGEELKPDNHTIVWKQTHGMESNAANANCTMCHQSGTKLDCQACHQGDAVINPHPKNYLSSHGQDAHMSDMRCGTCHEQRSFCVDCHRDMNILPADHFRAGFVTSTGGTHGDAAEFDLESCMSCHDTPNAEPTCARCHDAK